MHDFFVEKTRDKGDVEAFGVGLVVLVFFGG